MLAACRAQRQKARRSLAPSPKGIRPSPPPGPAPRRPGARTPRCRRLPPGRHYRRRPCRRWRFAPAAGRPPRRPPPTGPSGCWRPERAGRRPAATRSAPGPRPPPAGRPARAGAGAGRCAGRSPATGPLPSRLPERGPALAAAPAPTSSRPAPPAPAARPPRAGSPGSCAGWCATRWASDTSSSPSTSWSSRDRACRQVAVAAIDPRASRSSRRARCSCDFEVPVSTPIRAAISCRWPSMSCRTNTARARGGSARSARSRLKRASEEPPAPEAPPGTGKSCAASGSGPRCRARRSSRNSRTATVRSQEAKLARRRLR